MDLQPADPGSCACERARIEAFDMHPKNYALMQQALAFSNLTATDFVQLAIYLLSRDVVAQWGGTTAYCTGNQDSTFAE